MQEESPEKFSLKIKNLEESYKNSATFQAFEKNRFDPVEKDENLEISIKQSKMASPINSFVWLLWRSINASVSIKT